jgi:RNA polymerase sigma factor (sigma-70 family)
VLKSEAEHIEGIQRGDRKMMQEVYELYRRKVFGICSRYSNSKEEAADFMHDGFLKVFTEFGKFKKGVPLEAWIATVIRNNTINQIRKKIRISETSFEDETYTEGIDDIDQDEQDHWMKNISSEEVLYYMSLLPLKYRLILNMYAIDGMTHQEIATQTGMSEGTSKSQLSRARVKLIEIIRTDIQKKSDVTQNKPFPRQKPKAVQYEQIR